MTRLVPRIFWLGLILLAAVAGAAAGTLTGTVRNGTTGQPAAGVPVVLLRTMASMDAVADAKTDAQGRYRLEHDALGQEPMLIRVNFKGVLFHRQLPPGTNTSEIEIEVFEPTQDSKAVQVLTRLIALQPNGASLLVGEEYSLLNNTKPPAAQYKADGNFEFQVPESGELAEVSAWGPAGMPVIQGTIDKGPRRYAVAFAFRPGQSGVRFSYQVPYRGDQIVLRIPSPYATARTVILAPPPMQVSAAGFQPAGSEQGFNVYTRDAVHAGDALAISVSGTAPSPSTSGQPGAQGLESGNVPGVTVIPERLDSVKWILLGGFAALFLLGVIYLWRQPASAAPGKPAGEEISNRRRRKDAREKETREAAKTSPPLGAEQPEPITAAEVVAQATRNATRSLDEIKDTLFRLELRRQAGTISEEEYAREHSRAQQVLRELVKS